MHSPFVVRRALVASLVLCCLAVGATAQHTTDAGERPVLAPGPAAAARPALEVGQPYGKLHLPTVDGLRTLTVHGLRGKPALLIEFASW